MESLVIPVIILAVTGAGVALAARAFGRRQAAKQADAAPAPDTVDVARQAAAKLTEDQHRRLYALIAQGQAMAAIKLYYESTEDGLRAARDAVAALATHPQPYLSPAAQTPEADAYDDDSPQRFSYRYRAIASKGDVTREVSSNMLNDEIYGRIRTLARSGDAEGAANALIRHSDITLKQAREFIALLED